MKNVLLLKTGTVANALLLAAGDYDRWFARGFGARCHLTVVQLHQRQRPPAPASSYDAVVMTGSPLSVTAPEDWMKRAADDLMAAAARKVPVLGVCFGHQLLAWAHGAHVVKNPQGRETGTVEVTLTPEGEADPLFRGLPKRFAAQATHEDVVDRVPEGVTLLARNANTLLQAAAFGPHVRGVQFHPELHADAMRMLIETRKERLDAEGVARGAARGEKARALLAGVRPSPAGPKILANFLNHFA